MSRPFARLSGVVFGSLATASIAHALISLVGRWAPNAYADHAHGNATVVALFVASVASLCWLVATARALAGNLDVIAALASDIRRIEVVTAGISAALGGFAVLACIESLEDLNAFGRVGSLADLLGGNVLFGVCAIVVAALMLAVIGRSLAVWLLSVTEETANAWLSWAAFAFASTRYRIANDVSRDRRVRDRIGARYATFVRSMGGRRAPPRRVSTRTA